MYYVDNLKSNSNNMKEIEVIKQKSIKLFWKSGFKSTWHSNIPYNLPIQIPKVNILLSKRNLEIQPILLKH